MKKKPNELYLDIETSQLVGKTWTAYDTNLNRIIRTSYILSFAVKQNDGPIKVHALPDYRGFKKDHRNDLKLMEELREYMNWADVIIAHNGDRFDLRKINTSMLMHGLPPPSPYDTVDTLKIVKKHFGFPINKLDYVCRLLDIGRKIPHTGLDLWDECEDNPENMEAWSLLKRYNKHDIFLLEQLHKKIRAWATLHPNMNSVTLKREECPRCNSTNTKKNGVHVKLKTRTLVRYQRHHCMNCGHWFLGDIIKRDE